MPWSVANGADGIPRVMLTEVAGSSAVVCLHGAQVLSWKNEKHEELLFTSKKAIRKSPMPLRGGIHPCFPQFGNSGSLERRGFARDRLWELDASSTPFPQSRTMCWVDLILKSSTHDDLKAWPHSFELRLRIILTHSKLIMVPRVRNTDSKAFSFTFGIRNYLAVSDVSEVRVEGLETLDYFDNLLVNGERCTEQADAITFDGEIDRLYLRTPSKIAIIDHKKRRTLVLMKESLPDSGVWNPWCKKGKSLPDFADGDYKSMLCIDSAVSETSISLKPSEEWTSRQELSIVSSSYFSGQLDPRRVLSE